MIYTKDEATIHISFLKPKDPEYLIHNKTAEELKVVQKDFEGYSLSVPAEQVLPWTFDNFLLAEKRVTLTILNDTKDYSLDKIKKCKNLGDYNVEVVVQGVTRVIIISSEKLAADNSISNANTPKNTIKFIAKFPGIGCSIMNLRNTEELYLSLSGIDLKFKFIQEQFKNKTCSVLKFDIRIASLQIDNMDITGNLFPVILSKYQLKSEIADNTPFFQLKVQKESTKYSKDEPSLDKIKWLEVSLQPLQLKVNEETIYVILALKDLVSTLNNTAPVPFSLDTSLPVLPYKLSEIQRKAYFEFLRICAMKLEITFRKAVKQSKTGTQGNVGIFEILGSIGGAFTNISDSPIKFNEVMITHGFQTMLNLALILMKNYLRQGILQVYKILGSSDMIGNPLGLIDKLGTGVYEFVTEPAKGLLKGPKAFASGLGKGVKSLVGGIVAGGFGSVSKITGSLYTVLKEVSGDEPVAVRSSSKIGVFMYEGFKGGVMDVANGISGVFTKPYKGAQDQGAKGFFKGVGSGIFGLVSSPVKLVLKFGTTLTSGIASSANLLAKGKVQKFGRIRFPRQIAHKRVLEPYKAEFAQAQELLAKDGGNQRIVHYEHYSEEFDVIVIVTNKFFLYLVDTETIAKLSLTNVEELEVHKIEEKYVLYLNSNNEKAVIFSHNFGKLATIYYSVVSVIGQIKTLPEKTKKSSFPCFG